MAEPDYIIQSDEPKEGTKGLDWIRAALAEATRKRITHVRVSLEPDHDYILIEGWKVKPEKEGERRWSYPLAK